MSGKLTKKGLSNIKRDSVVFAFFLFLSFTFWYLNSLGKVAETEIKYPVKYINLPKDRVLFEELPSKLDIYVKGPGYSLLKLKLSGDRVPLILDVSSISYRRVSGARNMNYYVKTSSLVPKVSTQIGSECTITLIKPDTLFFAFDRIITKKVPVVADLGINTERQYFVKGKILVDPDSVRVTGPKHLLDTLNCVRTIFRKFSGLNRTFKRNVGICTSGDYSVSVRSAEVTVQVEQFTEAATKVRVKVLNAPLALDVRIFPDAVKVTGLVAVSDYRRFQDLPFDVVLDVSKADLDSEKRLPLEVRNIPPFVNSLRLDPPDVDFLIEKKAR